jgi:hypothetical protein
LVPKRGNSFRLRQLEDENNRLKRRGSSMQGHVFAPPHAHPDLQAVEAIEPADALVIHPPTLPTQQHPDPLVAKPGPGVGELTNPRSQR